MKWFVTRMLWTAAVACLLLPASAWGQSDLVQASTAAQKKEAQNTAKKPHVWTNDDLPHATDATVSVPSVAVPASLTGGQGKTAEGSQPEAAQQAAPAKPVMDVKTAEENLKKAREGVANTQQTIQVLQEKLATETMPNRREAYQFTLQKAQQNLPSEREQLQKAEKDYADAQAAQAQGQQPGQPAQGRPQPPPPPPPRL